MHLREKREPFFEKERKIAATPFFLGHASRGGKVQQQCKEIEVRYIIIYCWSVQFVRYGFRTTARISRQKVQHGFQGRFLGTVFEIFFLLFQIMGMDFEVRTDSLYIPYIGIEIEAKT